MGYSKYNRMAFHTIVLGVVTLVEA